MWENEYKKTIIRNVIIGILLVVLACGLLFAIIQVRSQIEQEDAQLSVIKSEQQQQQSDARKENVDVIQKAYETDMETVAQYMPGIVCWGDNLTSGSSGNASYPYTLQKYINTYLCDIYDFRSSIENAADFAWLNWENYQVSVPVVNMGSGQENSATVLGRAGVKPYVVKKGLEIPAGTESVAISITSQDGSAVAPLTAGNLGVNPVTIAGVDGTLTLESSGWEKSYSFCRLEAGEAVAVEAGTQITTAGTQEYQDYIHVVWLGNYDGYTSSAELVENVKLLLSRQAKNPERYLVIGPCTYAGSWGSNAARSLESIDSAMMQAFGSRYVNVRKYLVEDGLKDAGISATKLDSQYLAQGCIPDSFRSGSGGVELNGRAYELIGQVIYERMDRLGYFSEIRGELGIDKTTQEILKEDPKYFENMLKNS